MFIDSHVHLSEIENKYEYLNIINNSDSVDSIINVGLDVLSSKNGLFDASNNKVYTTVGIHPDRVDVKEKISDIYNMATYNKVVAIGEIGLENTDDEGKARLQEKYLIRQIIIANELKLPVIIHANNNLNEIKNIFEKFVKPRYGCVFHCYQPDIEFLKYIVDNGFYISFSGRILKPNAKKSIEVIKCVPKDLYMVETDAPYIEIPGYSDINSVYLSSVIKRISDIRAESYEEVSNQTLENTKRLFYKIK